MARILVTGGGGYLGSAKQKLNWEPKVSLDDGLKETISYFRKLLNDT